MKIALFIFSIIALVNGTWTMIAASSAIHQILAECSFISASILFAGAGIVETIENRRKLPKN